MKWIVLFYVIGTHQPSPLPPAVDLTYEEAETVAHSTNNWNLGVYGVIRRQASK